MRIKNNTDDDITIKSGESLQLGLGKDYNYESDHTRTTSERVRILKIIEDSYSNPSEGIEKITGRDKQLEKVIEIIVDDDLEVVEGVLDGNDGSVNYLVGQVMMKTNGKFDPSVVKDKVEEMYVS